MRGRERGIESRFASEVVARNRSIVNICCELNSKKNFGQDRLKKIHFLVFVSSCHKNSFSVKKVKKKTGFLVLIFVLPSVSKRIRRTCRSWGELFSLKNILNGWTQESNDGDIRLEERFKDSCSF